MSLWGSLVVGLDIADLTEMVGTVRDCTEAAAVVVAGTATVGTAMVGTATVGTATVGVAGIVGASMETAAQTVRLVLPGIVVWPGGLLSMKESGTAH
jgi:hypothetical protein